MKEKLQEMRKKWFRRDNLIVMVLSGILLFVIAVPSQSSGDKNGEKEGIFDLTTTIRESPSPESEKAGGDHQEYAREQEARLAAILSSVEGVGKVEVMITLSASEEVVLEKDRDVKHSGTGEADSSGGTRNVTQSEIDETTVYSTVDGDSIPYAVKTLTPRVEGVLVVAEGAGQGAVNRSITQTVQALFGVEAHRVKVLPAKQP